MFHTNNAGFNTISQNAAVFAAINGSVVNPAKQAAEADLVMSTRDETIAAVTAMFKNGTQEKSTVISAPETITDSTVLTEQRSTIHVTGLLGKISELEKAFSKKTKKAKKAKKAKKPAEEHAELTAPSAEVISIEVPLAYQVIGEDGTLGEVVLSDSSEVVEASVVEEAVAEPAGQVTEPAEVTKVVEAAIEKVPAEEQKTNPMVAAMARANERRATQPQHSHAKAEVRHRKVAEPK